MSKTRIKPELMLHAGSLSQAGCRTLREVRQGLDSISRTMDVELRTRYQIHDRIRKLTQDLEEAERLASRIATVAESSARSMQVLDQRLRSRVPRELRLGSLVSDSSSGTRSLDT